MFSCGVISELLLLKSRLTQNKKDTKYFSVKYPYENGKRFNEGNPLKKYDETDEIFVYYFNIYTHTYLRREPKKEVGRDKIVVRSGPM